MKKITMSVAALTIAMMSYGQTQCKGLTKDSVQCKNTVKNKVELCYLHNPNYVKSSKTVTVICTIDPTKIVSGFTRTVKSDANK